MRKMGLTPIYQTPKTSEPHPRHKIYPYLLRHLTIERPNHVWCADITYIPMRRGFLYLVAVMDWATRKVLAWRLSNTMEVDFCIEALREAMTRYGKPEIFNTDQGSQFTSFEFTQVLKEAEVKISMDGRGRQPIHRAAVALPEIRMRLPARVRDWLRSPAKYRQLDRLLQPREAPFRHRRIDPERGIWNELERRETGGVKQPAIHLVWPPKWFKKQDHLC